MGGPWEDFQTEVAESGPWEDFSRDDEAAPAAAETPAKKKGLGGRMMENLAESWREATTPLESTGRMTDTLPRLGEKILAVGAPLGRGLVGEPFGAFVKATLPSDAAGWLKAAGSFLADKPVFREQFETFKDIGEAWNWFEQNFPRPARDIKNAADMSLLAPGYVAARELGPVTLRAAKETARGVKSAATKAADYVMDYTPEEIAKKINAAVQFGMNKGVRPSVAGKKTASQSRLYYDRATDAVKSIIKNKENLVLSDAEGNAIAGQLPSSLKQFGEAIEQTKKAIFKQYDEIAARAGEQGATVDLSSVAREMVKVANSPVLRDINPNVAKYAMGRAQAFAKRRFYTPDEAQEAIAMFNKSLESFYKNPSYEGATRAGIDAMAVNNIRRSLDSIIEKTTGEQYQALKNSYGALKAAEKDVIHRAIVDARKNIHGLLDFSDIFTSGELLAGIATMNPSMMLRAGAWKGVKEFFKWRNNPNRVVKSMFRKTEGLMGKLPKYRAPGFDPLAGDISGVRPGPAGELPMPPAPPPALRGGRPPAGATEPFPESPIVEAEFTSRMQPKLPEGREPATPLLHGQGFELHTPEQAGQVIGDLRGGFDLVGKPSGPDVVDVPFRTRKRQGLPSAEERPQLPAPVGFTMREPPPKTILRKDSVRGSQSAEGVTVEHKPPRVARKGWDTREKAEAAMKRFAEDKDLSEANLEIIERDGRFGFRKKSRETGKETKRVYTGEDYRKMAEGLGLKYEGFQEAKGGHGYHQFTDPVTGSTIGLMPEKGETLYENLKISRQAWGKPVPERRVQPAMRKRFSEMTPEEQEIAFYTDDKTRLKNAKAWEEDPRKEILVSMDMDDLKKANDTYTHVVGDQLIAKMGEALKRASGNTAAYHVSGDEFWLQGNNQARLEKIVKKAKSILAKEPIDIEGKPYHVKFSHGFGKTKAEADIAMKADKAARKVQRGGELKLSSKAPKRPAEKMTGPQNLLTYIEKSGYLKAGKDYNLHELHQFPEGKRAFRKEGKLSPDEFADTLRGEGWDFSGSGDDLVELIKSGRVREIYRPEDRERLWGNKIEKEAYARAEEAVEKIKRQEGMDAGASEENRRSITAVLGDDIKSKGHIENEAALKSETDSFLKKVGIKPATEEKIQSDIEAILRRSDIQREAFKPRFAQPSKMYGVRSYVQKITKPEKPD